MTGYLRDCWYAVGWSMELSSGPIVRTILDEPIAVWRSDDGAVFAMVDRCPHRFAPLSLGKQDGTSVQCPYHGLTFGPDGRCIVNPHGNRSTAGLRVRSFPVVERYGMVWLWTGSLERLDSDQIPDLEFLDDDGFRCGHGYIRVDAHYELITDNLLDLSHVEFLHPFLSRPGTSAKRRFRCVKEGDSITAISDIPDEPPTALFQLFWDSDSATGQLSSTMRWSAPSNLLLEVTMTPTGDVLGSGPHFPSAHLLTPETATSTHYFWAIGRDRRLNDVELDAQLVTAVGNAFANEDEPMIRAVQQRMGTSDLMALKPALLSVDEASVQARRTLARRIAAEHLEGNEREAADAITQ